jgi:hypothetical protein
VYIYIYIVGPPYLCVPYPWVIKNIQEKIHWGWVWWLPSIIWRQRSGGPPFKESLSKKWAIPHLNQ